MKPLHHLLTVGVSTVISLEGIPWLTSGLAHAQAEGINSRLAEANSAEVAPSPSPQLPTLAPDASPSLPTDPTLESPATPVLERPAPRPVTPLPDFLNPSPNPLLFPTRPEEVQLEVVQPITLEQALELARRNNRELEVSELTLERSRAVLREAQAAEYPTLGVQADLTRQQNIQGSATNTLSGGAEIGYDLYTAGRRPATIRAAERQVRFNELDVERLREEIALNVTNAYYNLQQADEQVRIAQDAVTNAQASLRDAEVLEQAGVGTRFDVLRAQVQLANARQDLTRSLSQQQISRRQLAQLLSLPQTVGISAADPVQIAGLWNLPLEESIVLALQNRAELEQQLVQREVSEQQRLSALAAQQPQVGLFAAYNVLNALEGQGFRTGYSVGARLRWNLFDGGATTARAEQQEANRAIAESRFADNRNLVRFQVEQSYSNLQANFENIQTASVALEQARESLRLARLRFQAGVGTQLDEINALTELTRAEVNRLNAILDYNRALASLQRAVSNLAR